MGQSKGSMQRRLALPALTSSPHTVARPCGRGPPFFFPPERARAHTRPRAHPAYHPPAEF